MKKITHLSAGVLATSALALGALSAPAGAANTAPAARAGNTSIAEVLGADGQRLDRRPNDFDVAEAAVFAVLDAKPGSPVGLLADGTQRLTIFVPTDDAFARLVKDLKGFRPKTEAKTLKQVSKLGIDTIETVLLYHVIPGKTLPSSKVVKANKKLLKTAAGKTVKVSVGHEGVKLIDKDRNDRNPIAKPKLLDINKGNKQIAHGIDRVLRPVDL